MEMSGGAVSGERDLQDCPGSRTDSRWCLRRGLYYIMLSADRLSRSAGSHGHHDIAHDSTYTLVESILRRQCGQVLCWLSHALMQSKWNQWVQGSTVTSVSSSTASMQIEHSALTSDPIISFVIFFFGSERIAVSGAGGGAVPCCV